MSQGYGGEDQEFQSLIKSLENTEARVEFVKSLMSWPSSKHKKTLSLTEIYQVVAQAEQETRRKNDPQERANRYLKEVRMMTETGALKDQRLKFIVNLQLFNLNQLNLIDRLECLYKKICTFNTIESLVPGLIATTNLDSTLTKSYGSPDEEIQKLEAIQVTIAQLISQNPQ